MAFYNTGCVECKLSSILKKYRKVEMIKKSYNHALLLQFFFCYSKNKIFHCRSDVFLSCFHVFHLLCELLIELLPQVGQLLHIRLVGVSALLQLEESLEEQEIFLLFLQSFPQSTPSLVFAAKDGSCEQVDQVEGRRKCRSRSQELSLSK